MGQKTEKMMLAEARRRCADVDWYIERATRTDDGWATDGQTPMDGYGNGVMSLFVRDKTRGAVYARLVVAVEAIAAADAVLDIAAKLRGDA